jgi:hypothetical protein
VSGTGNNQTIANSVALSQVPGPGTYTATMVVRTAGLPDSAVYTVTLVYTEPQNAPVVVSQPLTGSVHEIGDTLTVAWNANCLEVPGVKVELTINGGESWTIIEVSGTLPCGAQLWTWPIPDSIMDTELGHKVPIVSSQCIVKVANYNGAGEGESGVFSIVEEIAVRDRMHGRSNSLYGLRSVGRNTFGVSMPEGVVATLQIVRPDGAVVFEQLVGNHGTVAAPRLAQGTYVYRLGNVQGTLVVQ